MARRPRPTGVPADAWWSREDREWVLGGKDARGRLHGLVRYWRSDGTLVSEARFRNGVLHGRARRIYENGATFQTCTYVNGVLHGRRMFYPPTGPTVEPPIARWQEVGANVVAYRVDYDRGDVIATRFIDARGREVRMRGEPMPRRPRGVPATASPMGDGWIEMRRSGDNGEHTLISREYRADGSLHREQVRGIERELHDNGALAQEGRRVAHRMHGPWRYYDRDGVLRRESTFARGVEIQRAWCLIAGEHSDGARRRTGPVAALAEGETLEHGTWIVSGARSRVIARVRLGPPLDDAAVLALPVLADRELSPDELGAMTRGTGVAAICARIRIAGVTGSREALLRVLGPPAPWTDRDLELVERPLADRAGRFESPPWMEVVDGLLWGAPPGPLLAAIAAMLFRERRPRVALDVVRAARLWDDAPVRRDAEASYLRELGEHGEADAIATANPDRIEGDEERLLLAIRDAPDDDAPRLVYADWLAQRGDSRGELIVAACRLAQLDDDDPASASLERRIGELADAGRAIWLGPLAEKLDGDFDRGFLQRVSVGAADVVAHADRIFRVAPVRELVIDHAGDAVTQLAACPALARYRALRFDDTVIDDDEYERLARCEYLVGLEELGLYNASLGSAALAAIARSPHLGNLRVLDIGGRDNDFLLAGFHTLANAAFAPKLESLRIYQRWLDPEAIATLAAFPSLVRLEAGCNRFGENGAAAALAALPLALVELGLYMNHIDELGARALADAPLLGRVESLDVSANPMGQAGALALVRSSHLGALRRLTFGGEHGVPDAVVARAIAASLPALEELDLTLAQVGADGAAARAAGDVAQLERLSLYQNAIGDAGAIAIARSTTLRALMWLDLSHNAITDVGAVALAEAPYLDALAAVQLAGATLGPRGRDALRARFGVAPDDD